MKSELFRDVPIRVKIRLISLIVSGAALIGAFSAFLFFQRVSSWEVLAQQCEALAEIVGDQSSAALEFSQREAALAILASLRAQQNIALAAVYGRDGRKFAEYVRAGDSPELAPEAPGPDGHRTERGELHVFKPILSGGERIGTLYLSSDMREVREWLWLSAGVTVLLLAAAAIAIPFLSGWLGRSVTRPVLHLASVVQAVSSARDYSLRALPSGSDELGHLIQGFNDMLAQIQARDDALARARDELEQRVQERTRELQHEVQQHRAAEELLLEKDLRLTEAQQIAHLGSWEWDLLSDRVAYTDEVYRIHGLLASELPGSYEEFLKRAHPDDRPALSNALENARRNRQPFSLEYRILRPDGESRYLHMQGKVALDDDGRPRRLVGALQDATARRHADLEIQKLNRELQQRMGELEASNKELESFSYSVSHDLRAPLRAIDGFSEMVLESCAEKLDEEAKHCLARVRAGSQRMGELIDGLLDLARITRSEMGRREVDLSAMALEIMAELQARDPQRAVDWAIAPGLLVHADVRLLRPALVNLLENAWKYSRKREVARIEVGAEEREGRPVYFVRDNGVGFDMAYTKKLFGVFQRLHTEREFEGTGIGLATVQRIIQRHGGRIWAEAAVEQGATFFFTL